MWGDNLYYIYENWVAEKKVVIHKGVCSFCNNGEGVQKNPLENSNGRWHGPFNSYEYTKKFAQSIHNRKLKECSFCKPKMR